MDSNPPRPAQQLQPNLSGTPETLLGTLHSRAMDAQSPRPILGDQHASRIVAQLDYDFSKHDVSPNKAALFSLRASFFDRWVRDFLEHARQKRESVTVLHLAVGLDTRALRLQQDCNLDGSDVHWVDVDLPDVVDVRRKLNIPAPEAKSQRLRYQLLGADVTDERWLAASGLPRDRPTLAVFEGLSMYLQPAQGRALIEQLTNYFVAKGNQLAFDCVNWVALFGQRFEPIVVNTGSSFSWAVGDPRDLEQCHQGLHLRDEILGIDDPGIAGLPASVRFLCWLFSWLPAIRETIRYLRFEW